MCVCVRACACACVCVCGGGSIQTSSIVFRDVLARDSQPIKSIAMPASLQPPTKGSFAASAKFVLNSGFWCIMKLHLHNFRE